MFYYLPLIQININMHTITNLVKLYKVSKVVVDNTFSVSSIKTISRCEE